MKQKTFCLLLIMMCCNLLASPNKSDKAGEPCPYSIKEKPATILPAKKSTPAFAEDVKYLPMHQLVNSL